MVDLSNYLNILRGALQFGGVSPFADAQASRLFDYLRRAGTPTPPTPPETPAPTETVTPAPPQPASSGPPRRPASSVPAPSAATTEPFPLPPIPPASTSAPPQSLLDRLRERMSNELENPGLRAASDIGTGMLASNSPNFFTMLGAGLQAQQAAERGRVQDLRQAASTEAEDAYRRRSLELREEELRDPSIRALREAQARYYAMGGRGGFGSSTSPRGNIDPRTYARIFNEAETEARRQFPDPMPGMPDTDAQRSERAMLRARFRDERLRILLDAAERLQSGASPTEVAPRQSAPTQEPQRIPTRIM